MRRYTLKFPRRRGPVTMDYIRERSVIEGATGCWIWQAGTSQGYGRVRFNGRDTLAHRASYQLATGRTLLREVHICHHCDTPRCVNPEHMFEGSRSDNMQDAIRKGRFWTGEPKRGSANKRAKLTEDAVQKIRLDNRPPGKVAEEYGVSRTAIRLAKANRTWTHVK